MIISASYKTDIPAFYGKWFLNRLEAGYCMMVNPYNANQHSRISLSRTDVEGFVFWTKNAGPFLQSLQEIADRSFPFVVQYTINGYPRSLESRVLDPEKSIRHVREISSRFGKCSIVWRYDPIIFTSNTDSAFHRENFSRLAGRLSGAVDEVVVSFMQPYKKTKTNLDVAGRDDGFTWWEPTPEEKREFLLEYREIAKKNGMQLALCSQPELLVDGVKDARCVDADRLSKVAGQQFNVKLRGMREGCGCYASKDIGAYDTCPHGCVYCYAVRNRPLALQRYTAHDPEGEYLFPAQTPKASKPRRQLRLFD